MTAEAKPPAEVSLEDAAKALLSAQGWHAIGDCIHDDCMPDFLTPHPEPLLGARTDDDAIGLARAFEQLHKLAHPDQSPHLALCKSEPCRSMPWAVVNEIAKVA